ncbi:MAG: pirin family protein [Proteocatella sp.]
MKKVVKVVRGQDAVDGAGVHLLRVLGRDTAEEFDPFLLLDSFDSRNSEDYIKGFPMHPHRGIETITYLAEGELIHRDSLGNSGIIKNGGAQWMTAGSGILHEEMPQAAERMLGIQLWLNMAGSEKMAEPHYFDITKENIKVVEEEGYHVRILSGKFGGVQGSKTRHIHLSFLDVSLDAGSEIVIPSKFKDTTIVFLLEGDCTIDGETYHEKSALLFGEGDRVEVEAGAEPSRFLFIEGLPLKESIAWGGPIVMNTRAELELAFDELNKNTFIKHKQGLK